jgi:hypothetical protein
VSIHAYGWLPDSIHFIYAQEPGGQTFLGEVTGTPPLEMDITGYETIRWLDAERFLAKREDSLYLGDINRGETLVAENVSYFDFEQ